MRKICLYRCPVVDHKTLKTGIKSRLKVEYRSEDKKPTKNPTPFIRLDLSSQPAQKCAIFLPRPVSQFLILQSQVKSQGVGEQTRGVVLRIQHIQEQNNVSFAEIMPQI